jgi:hypothetical protein
MTERPIGYPGMARSNRKSAAPRSAVHTRWHSAVVGLCTLLVLTGAWALHRPPSRDNNSIGASAAVMPAPMPRVKLVKSAHRATPVLTVER